MLHRGIFLLLLSLSLSLFSGKSDADPYCCCGNYPHGCTAGDNNCCASNNLYTSLATKENICTDNNADMSGDSSACTTYPYCCCNESQCISSDNKCCSITSGHPMP